MKWILLSLVSNRSIVAAKNCPSSSDARLNNEKWQLANSQFSTLLLSITVRESIFFSFKRLNILFLNATYLTRSRRRPLSYRNQSIDWFRLTGFCMIETSAVKVKKTHLQHEQNMKRENCGWVEKGNTKNIWTF